VPFSPKEKGLIKNNATITNKSVVIKRKHTKAIHHAKLPDKATNIKYVEY